MTNPITRAADTHLTLSALHEAKYDIISSIGWSRTANNKRKPCSFCLLDPDRTGSFHWRYEMQYIQLTQGKSVLVDDEDYIYLHLYKWHLHHKCATRSSVHGEIYMHRVIMNAPEGMDVDHINHDSLDNRKENLRICTHAENMMNRSKQKNSTSGFKGVYWNKGKEKWQAQISVKNKNICLGRFNAIEDAAKAYDDAAEKYYGKYAEKNYK